MNYIFIKDSDRTYSYEVKNMNDTISSVIDYTCNRIKIKKNNFWLGYGGKILLPHYKIKDYIPSNSTIHLNWRTINIVDVRVGNKIYTLDLYMLNDSEVFFNQFTPSLFKLNKESYVIPQKYLDDETYKLWYKLYEIKKNNKLYNIKKPLSYDINDIMHPEFYNFLQECSYEQIIKLGKLFDYLKIKSFFDLICAFIAYEYLREDFS